MDLRIVIPEKYKSLFEDSDTITIEELFSTIDELNSEIDRLKEESDDYKEYVKDNYRELSQAELIGYNERDFFEER